MLRLQEVLRKRSDDGLVSVALPYTIQKIQTDKRLVTGQVYAPNSLDAHDDFMMADTLEKVAHDFLANGKQDQIDVMHDNNLVDAVVVESFIARGHPQYEEGAWVATVKINDDLLWTAVKQGQINGYSFEILTYKEDVQVEVEFSAYYYGFTDPATSDKHVHAFLIKMDSSGKIMWGETSAAEDGHTHDITRSNITQKTGGHNHRIHLENTDEAKN